MVKRWAKYYVRKTIPEGLKGVQKSLIEVDVNGKRRYRKKAHQKEDVQVRVADFIPKEHQKIDEYTVQFYCKHSKSLARSQTSKASKFISYGCVHFIGKDFGREHSVGQDNVFVCLPLNQKDFTLVDDEIYLKKKPYEKYYNNTDYKMWWDEHKHRFECQCQGWTTADRNKKDPENKMNGILCSHLLALRYAIMLNAFEGKTNVPQEFSNMDEYFNFLEKKKRGRKPNV